MPPSDAVDPPSRFPLDLSIRVGCELVYRTKAETPIVILFKPRHAPTQLIREERIHFEPGLLPSEFVDEHRNIVYRMMLKPGINLIRHDAIVQVPSVREDAFRAEGFVPPQDLPPSVLPYALPSRYADSDRMRDLAWQKFGHLSGGLERVQAICDWTHANIEYRTGSGDATLSAWEIVQRGYGVCRDFAHVALALCRTFNIPARYVTGHVPDIGVVDPGVPFDFHAYFEVYVAHFWQTFDARYNQPRVGRVKIASGLDAANCAFSTVYGGAELERFEVWAYQIDPQEVSTRDPIDVNRRLDGTETIRFAHTRRA